MFYLVFKLPNIKKPKRIAELRIWLQKQNDRSWEAVDRKMNVDNYDQRTRSRRGPTLNIGSSYNAKQLVSELTFDRYTV